jgi:hypothetical protein
MSVRVTNTFWWGWFLVVSFKFYPQKPQEALNLLVTEERYWALFYMPSLTEERYWALFLHATVYFFYTICWMYWYRLQIKWDYIKIEQSKSKEPLSTTKSAVSAMSHRTVALESIMRVSWQWKIDPACDVIVSLFISPSAADGCHRMDVLYRHAIALWNKGIRMRRHMTGHL